MMGIFIDLLNQFKIYNTEFNDGDQLNLFFELFARYNEGRRLPKKLRDKIETYFDYRWQKDKCAAIDSIDELEILYQMPHFVQDRLIAGYLNGTFLKKFSDFFRLQKEKEYSANLLDTRMRKQHVVLTWEDQYFRELMISILINLEPFFHDKRKVLLGELEECNQIMFIAKGKVLVGYELNNEKRYCVRFSRREKNYTAALGAKVS